MNPDELVSMQQQPSTYHCHDLVLSFGLVYVPLRWSSDFVGVQTFLMSIFIKSTVGLQVFATHNLRIIESHSGKNQ
jgi:hypothetical protein